MITFKLTEKRNGNFSEICNALKCFKGVSIAEISKNSALVKMPQNYFEIFSRTIEYYGIINIL